MNYEGHPDQRYGHITYSHCGEDLMILNLFELMRIQKPSYLDIGSHHPFTISNTALLYQRGSRGINVEANPNLMEAFRDHRPEDININMGISTQPGIMKFYMWDKTSGRNTFSQEWSKRLEVHTETIELPVTTMSYVIDTYFNSEYPDLLTIDIEGLDYDVLDQADFSKSSPKIVCAETYQQDSLKFKQMMFNKGFMFYSRHTVDSIFVHKDYFHFVT